MGTRAKKMNMTLQKKVKLKKRDWSMLYTLIIEEHILNSDRTPLKQRVRTKPSRETLASRPSEAQPWCGTEPSPRSSDSQQERAEQRGTRIYLFPLYASKGSRNRWSLSSSFLQKTALQETLHWRPPGCSSPLFAWPNSSHFCLPEMQRYYEKELFWITLKIICRSCFRLLSCLSRTLRKATLQR